MFSAPLKSLFRSLRFRLLIWNTLIVLFLIAICLLLVRQGTHLARFDLLDDFLDEELDSVCAEIAAGSDKPAVLQATIDRRASYHPRRKMFIQLLDADGTVRWSSVHSPAAPMPQHPPPSPERPVTWQDYRFQERRLPSGQSPYQRVRVGVSLDRMRMEMRQMTEIVLGVGGAFLLVCPAAAYLLTARAMRPLGKIVETTNRIVPGNLDQRLPLRDGGGELDQISATINNLLDRLDQFIQMNRRWLTDAAHELRSPLTGMRATLELAVSQERSPDEYREAIHNVLSDSDDLITLLNKMLILGEGDGGVLEIRKEPVALNELIERSLDMYQAVAEAKRIDLRVAPLEPLTVLGDRQLLSQVLNNLLDNALKYTPPDGTVRVKLSSAGNDTAILQVTDSGIGIPPEDMPKLFQRFFRGDKSRSRCEPQGHGLGLSLCQTFVQAHHGAINVVSTLGLGSTFTVTLPRI